MRRSVGPFVLVIACLGALWWWKTHGEKADPAPTSGSATTTTGSGSGAAPAMKKPPAHATRITPEERKELAQRIDSARKSRAAMPHSAPLAPSLPSAGSDGSGDLEHVKTNVQTAMKEAIPFLAECYKVNAPAATKQAGLTLRAQMTLTTDPDIGTVIDADQIFDENKQPIDKKLDDCLRNTMQTLELPPLEEGQAVRIEYSFRFGDDDK